LRESTRKSVSPEGEIAPRPDKGEVRHLRAKEEGEVVERVFQWGDVDDGTWIQASESDCVNLYSKV
jgi:hypothetical protein